MPELSSNKTSDLVSFLAAINSVFFAPVRECSEIIRTSAHSYRPDLLRLARGRKLSRIATFTVGSMPEPRDQHGPWCPYYYLVPDQVRVFKVSWKAIT